MQFPDNQEQSPVQFPSIMQTLSGSNFVGPRDRFMMSSTFGTQKQFGTMLNQRYNQIKDNENQIESLTREIQQLEFQMDQDKQKNQNIFRTEEDDIKELMNQIIDLEKEISQFSTAVFLEKQKIIRTDKEIKNLDDKLRSTKTLLDELDSKQFQNDQYQKNQQLIEKIRKQKDQELQQQNNEIENLQKKIDKIKQEILKQNLELHEQQKYLEKFLFTQEDYKNDQTELEKKKQYFQESRDQFNQLTKTYADLITGKKIKSSEVENLSQRNKDKEEEKNKIIEEISKMKSELPKYEQQMTEIKNLVDSVIEAQQLNSKIYNRQPLNQYQIDYQKILKEKEAEQKKIQQEIAEIQRQQDEQNFLQLNQANKAQQAKQKQAAEARLNKANQEIDKAMKTHGQLDVCFIVDVTGSMDRYKDQTKKSVQQTLKVVKQVCNRETNWSAICYQDFAEKKMMGEYYQFQFQKNPEAIEKWLDTIRCSGGDDGAEDIRGGIKQMCKLNWTNKFRIAILICDAPTHGKKYCSTTVDDHPDEDIRDAILKMIENNILFLGLNFTKSTTKMYEEIEKIYVEKNKTDLFLKADLVNLNIEQAGAQMAKWIGKASENATQTNKSSTKTKNQQQQQNVEQEKNSKGAIEALCKLTNFNNFDEQENIEKVNVQFKVLKIEISENSFEKNLTQIAKIKEPSDYSITEEGKWDCVRTEKPFAFGMMKDVFLMKKVGKDSNELYVIKTPKGSQPYTSRDSAILECRSHLICQRLMKKFQDDIERKQSEKNIQLQPPIPKVIYSDFLILEESPVKFWIAERFFSGEFIKYNNNYGYINDENTQYNKLAQAFSFYTYVISETNYMISDVQGVDKYFTDPAVNTIEGNFDETDMGDDGIKMYLVSYNQKKELLSKEILELLDCYK